MSTDNRIEEFMNTLDYYINEKINAAIGSHENASYESYSYLNNYRMIEVYNDLCKKLNEIIQESNGQKSIED